MAQVTETPAPARESNADPATIQFSGVTKRYPGSARGAVEDVSFDVRSGTICMLVGTSGSGKTTLLRMVNRLIDPTSGTIRIDSVATVDQNPIELRRHIGYVIQQVGLFPHLTIAENVAVVPSILGEPKRRSRCEWMSCWSWLACPPTSIASAIRASSPAASNSAWGWPGRSPPIRRSC